MLGICGGYQMLGERLSDFVGAEAEAGRVEPGLNLLPVETFFEPISEKITLQSQAQVDESAVRGLFAHLHGQHFQTYQIHLGRTVAAAGRNGMLARALLRRIPTQVKMAGSVLIVGVQDAIYTACSKTTTSDRVLSAALAGRRSASLSY